MNKVFILIAIVLIEGCATTLTPEAMSRKSNLEVCTSGHQIGNKLLFGEAPNFEEAIKAELLRRKLVTQEEFTFARSNRVRMGMSECALIMSMGNPQGAGNCGRINETVGSFGVHKQYVYRDCSSRSKTNYVYTENGLVTSWQF